MSDRDVSCSECGLFLDEDASAALEARQPCPNCGSLARTISLEFGGKLGPEGTVKIGTALETEIAMPITPKKGQAPKTTAVGVATHSCEVRITPPSGELEYYYLEVVRGAEIIATGMGDDLPDALLEVIEYLLPPDHPEYPQGAEFPDDTGLSG